MTDLQRVGPCISFKKRFVLAYVSMARHREKTTVAEPAVRCETVHETRIRFLTFLLQNVLRALLSRGQDKLALGDDADVVSVVTVGRYDGARGVRGKQDVAVFCLQLECVEKAVKRRQVAKQFRKMRHMLFK